MTGGGRAGPRSQKNNVLGEVCRTKMVTPTSFFEVLGKRGAVLKRTSEKAVDTAKMGEGGFSNRRGGGPMVG